MKRDAAPRSHSTLPIAVLLCALGSGALAMTAVRTAVDRQLSELHELHERRQRTAGEIEQLQIDVAKLTSIEQLEPAARRLGMHYPLPEQLIGPSSTAQRSRGAPAGSGR